jgi:hypothetical protein
MRLCNIDPCHNAASLGGWAGDMIYRDTRKFATRRSKRANHFGDTICRGRQTEDKGLAMERGG